MKEETPPEGEEKPKPAKEEKPPEKEKGPELAKPKFEADPTAPVLQEDELEEPASFVKLEDREDDIWGDLLASFAKALENINALRKQEKLEPVQQFAALGVAE